MSIDIWDRSNKNDIAHKKIRITNTMLYSVNNEIQDFSKLIKEEPSILDNREKLIEALHNVFPTPLQANLLMSAYDEGICEDIYQCEVLVEETLYRIQQKLQNHHGIKDVYAKWAVVIWFRIFEKTISVEKNILDESENEIMGMIGSLPHELYLTGCKYQQNGDLSIAEAYFKVASNMGDDDAKRTIEILVIKPKK